METFNLSFSAPFGSFTITAVKIDHDVNGNPRYYVEKYDLLPDLKKASDQAASSAFERRARALGHVYRGKKFGAGCVFQSFSIYNTLRMMADAIVDDWKTGGVKLRDRKRDGAQYAWLLDEVLNGDVFEGLNDREKLCAFWHEFNRYFKGFAPGYFGRLSYVEIFGDWLRGLPSGVNLEYENYNILQLLKSWGVDCWKDFEYWSEAPAIVWKRLEDYWPRVALLAFRAAEAHGLQVKTL